MSAGASRSTLAPGMPSVASHHMRCPKCGGHLKSRTLHGIEVETCEDCKGSWFDYGEVRAILAHYDKGLVFRIMDDVMGAFGKKPSPKDETTDSQH